MRDEDKTREQLIAELREARERIAVGVGSARGFAPEPKAEFDFRHVAANYPMATMVLDRHYVIQEVSPDVTTLFGMTRDQLIGRRLDEALPSTYDQHRPIFDAIHATGETFKSDRFRFMVRDGEAERETFWNTLWTPLMVDGRLEGYIGVGQEITERVRLEAEAEERVREIKRQRDLNTQIIDNAPAGIGFMDKDLVFRWANPKLASFLSVRVEDMLDRHVCDIFPEVKDQYEPIMHQVLDTNETFRATEMPFYYNIHGEDRVTYWDFQYMPVPGEDGQPCGILVLNQEVSDRVAKVRLLSDQVQHLQGIDRLKTNFINAVSHELRTPLASILGYAEFLEDGLGGPLSDTQRDYIDHIQSGVRRLRLLVDDLLDYARMEAGRFSITTHPSDLEKMANEAVASLAPMSRESEVQVSVSSAAEGRLVGVDARRIEQVVLNLVSNAIKFTPRGGTVEVKISWSPEGGRVEVCDSGIGIAPEHVGQVFEKFFQADASTTRLRGGAGLGLAISKAIVEAHGGAIGVESQVSRGSTFWFTLPG